MQIGRAVKGKQIMPLTNPALRQEISAHLYESDEVVGPYRVQLLCTPSSNWAESIELTLSGAERLRDNLTRLLERGKP